MTNCPQITDSFDASYLGRKYILKNLPKEVFSDQFDMQRALRESPHLRVCQDTIPERNIFVFDYMKDEYLSMASMDLPLPLTKRILKDVLRGLAELHSRRVIHLGKLMSVPQLKLTNIRQM